MPRRKRTPYAFNQRTDPQGLQRRRRYRIVTEDLVSWWTFVDGFGTLTLVDRIGGNDGSVDNATTGIFWGNGKGQGVFDGSDEKVSMGNVLAVGTNSFSVGVWLNIANLTPNDVFICKGSFNSEGKWIFQIATGTEFSPVFEDAAANSFSAANDGGSVGLNQWIYLLVATDRTAGTCTLYRNGVQHGSAQDISAVTGSLDNARNFTIGSRHDTAKPIDAQIGSTQMYIPKVLTAAEADQNFRAERRTYGI